MCECVCLLLIHVKTSDLDEICHHRILMMMMRVGCLEKTHRLLFILLRVFSQERDSLKILMVELRVVKYGTIVFLMEPQLFAIFLIFLFISISALYYIFMRAFKFIFFPRKSKWCQIFSEYDFNIFWCWACFCHSLDSRNIWTRPTRTVPDVDDRI